MKNILASCAVIALMTAPAVAQSASEPTAPLIESEQTLDPAMRDETVSPDPVNPEAAVEAEPTEGVYQETEDETAAATMPDGAMTAAAPEDAQQEMLEDADMQGDAAGVADTATPMQTGAMSQAEPFEALIIEASLPDDYSTGDLNAMMLAQLQVVSADRAEATFVSDTNDYASAPSSSDAKADIAMTGAMQPCQPMSGGYASTESMPAESDTTPDAYAATGPVDRPSERDASDANRTDMMAGDTTDAQQMADQSYGMTFTSEGDIDQTALDIAARDERFTTLVELVGIAGLEADLALEGPYTVFAPTNEAFAALPQDTLDHLKSEAGRTELVAILKAHVVEGTVLARDLPVAGQALETIGDASLNVTGNSDGSLKVQESKTIGEGIAASNGVIYAVDAVILPEASPAPAGN